MEPTDRLRAFQILELRDRLLLARELERTAPDAGTRERAREVATELRERLVALAGDVHPLV